MIKDSRDVQKLAKLGIYAVIRGNLGDAKAKLCEAAVIAKKIFITVGQVKFKFGSPPIISYYLTNQL